MGPGQLSKVKKSRPLLLGIGLLVVLVVAVYVAYNATSGIPGTKRTYAKATFDHVGELLVDDDVRIGQLRTGRVSDISLEDGRAVVTVELDGEWKLYRDARVSIGGEKAEEKAAIHDRSALGQKYLNLYPGTAQAGLLRPGEMIKEDRTQGSQNADKLFNVFDPATRRAAGVTLRELGHGFKGHSQDFRDVLGSGPQVLSDLGTVSRALANDRGDSIVGVLRSADSLARRFEGRERQIADLTDQTARTLRSVNVDHGVPLAKSLRRAPGTLRLAREALGKVQAPLRSLTVAGRSLEPGARALGEATPDLRGTLREAPLPLQKVPGVAKQATPAVERLRDLMVDARPFAPRASRALESLNPLVSTLAPYSPEIGLAFDNMASALAHGPNDGTANEGSGGRYLRIHLMLAPENVDGQLGINDPLVPRNAYPAPGEAKHDRLGVEPVLRDQTGKAGDW